MNRETKALALVERLWAEGWSAPFIRLRLLYYCARVGLEPPPIEWSSLRQNPAQKAPGWLSGRLRSKTFDSLAPHLVGYGRSSS